MNIKHILAMLALGAVLVGCGHTTQDTPATEDTTETSATSTVPESNTDSLQVESIETEVAEVESTETEVAEVAEVEATETEVVEETPTVEDVVQKFASSVDDKVYFAYNKFNLSDETKRVLDTQADFVSEYEGLIIVIEGHADERGTREYNFALAQKRANAVREYLQERDEGNNQYKVISYGKERPAVLGSNEEAWAKNRRAVTIVQ